MEFLGPMSEPGVPREPVFGPVVVAREDMSPTDRLIALTGRDPDWRPQQR